MCQSDLQELTTSSLSNNSHMTAMKSAFTTLGYKSYHASETGVSGVVHPMIYWKEGIENKYLGKGKPYGKAEFDKLLKNYSVRDPHRSRNKP